MPRARSHRDGCLVPAEPIAELVRVEVERWNRDRPQPGGQYGLQEGETPIQALAWLSAEATRHAVSFTVTRGTLEGLLDRGPRAKLTLELRVADAIVTALGRPEVMWDPRVVISPNPQARRSEQATCCSGSKQSKAVLDGLAVLAAA